LAAVARRVDAAIILLLLAVEAISDCDIEERFLFRVAPLFRSSSSSYARLLEEGVDEELVAPLASASVEGVAGHDAPRWASGFFSGAAAFTPHGRKNSAGRPSVKLWSERQTTRYVPSKLHLATFAGSQLESKRASTR
jgi:hypothetical protein